MREIIDSEVAWMNCVIVGLHFLGMSELLWDVMNWFEDSIERQSLKRVCRLKV